MFVLVARLPKTICHPRPQRSIASASPELAQVMMLSNAVKPVEFVKFMERILQQALDSSAADRSRVSTPDRAVAPPPAE